MITSAKRMLKVYSYIRRRATKRKEFIFFACMPKTASTFLVRSIHHLTGYRVAPLNYAFERNEQELYVPLLIDNYSIATVTQQHVKATGPNLDLMRAYGIRPVILVRSLYDVLPSIRDYLLADGVERFPSLYATSEFAQADFGRQMDFLITYALPWYFNFYASWYDVTQAGTVETKWVSYEDLRSDWVGGIIKILEFYGLEYTVDEVSAAIKTTKSEDRTQIRFNKGIVGRGELLTDQQRERIREMAGFYHWVDFGLVGIV